MQSAATASYTLGVSCAAGGHVVMLSMLTDGIFHNGAVEADWDDGTSGRYVFADNNTALMATAVRSLGAGAGYSPEIAGLVSKLRQRGAVRIRVLAQMPDDVSPERSRSGADRTFIYRFTDGSRLTLVARPAGGRSGLALYYVDIED